MPLNMFFRWITDQTGVSVICDQTLDDKPLTIDVANTPLPDLLAAVARRMAVDITQSGNLYYMGAVKAEDRGVLVRKVRRLGADDLQKTVAVLLSELGKVSAYSDGLLVVSDRVGVLQRVSTMLDQIEAAPSNTWILQLYLISTQDTFTRELGLDTAVGLDVAATFAAAAANKSAAVATNKAATAISAMLKAARTTGSAKIIAEPLLLLLDGSEATFQDGESIPIPQKTVSDNGTVTTSNFQFVQTGVIIKSLLREVSQSTAKCQLSIELTNVTAYVETAPITAGQKFSTVAVLESGGVYLLGSMSRSTRQRDTEGPGLPTLFKHKDQAGVVQIWMRCFRVAGPLKERSL